MDEQGVRNNEQKNPGSFPALNTSFQGQKTSPSLARELGTSMPRHWPSWQLHHPIRGTLILSPLI